MSSPTHVQQPGSCAAGVGASLGSESCRMTCPHCHALINTTTEKKLGPIGWLSALLMCGIGCCCIPFLIDTCKNVKHNCPNCQAYLGEYKSL